MHRTTVSIDLHGVGWILFKLFTDLTMCMPSILKQKPFPHFDTDALTRCLQKVLMVVGKSKTAQV